MGFAPQILMHSINGKDNIVDPCKKTCPGAGVVDNELLCVATVKLEEHQ